MLSDHQPCFHDHPFFVTFLFRGDDERTMNQPLVMVIEYVCMVKQL